MSGSIELGNALINQTTASPHALNIYLELCLGLVPEDCAIVFPTPGKGKKYFLTPNVQTWFGTHTSLSLGIKAAQVWR
jgi:hypothetical protein